MFLSTTSIRPFVQNENPDNTGFKKPGASKSGGLSLRTPFKDRSVNSVSPTSKYNSKLQMQKKSETPSTKNILKSATSIQFEPKVEADDIYMNDYASYNEVDYGYADIFPSKHIDIMKLLRKYVSGGESPKYIPEDDEANEPMELPVFNLEMRCSPLPTPVNIEDVPLPVFNY